MVHRNNAYLMSNFFFYLNYPGLQAGVSGSQIKTGLQPETNFSKPYLRINSLNSS